MYLKDTHYHKPLFSGTLHWGMSVPQGLILQRLLQSWLSEGGGGASDMDSTLTDALLTSEYLLMSMMLWNLIHGYKQMTGEVGCTISSFICLYLLEL